MSEDVEKALIDWAERLERDVSDKAPAEAATTVGRAFPELIHHAWRLIAPHWNGRFRYQLIRSVDASRNQQLVTEALIWSKLLLGRGISTAEIQHVIGGHLSERRIRDIVNGPLYYFTMIDPLGADDDARGTRYLPCMEPRLNPDLDEEDAEIIAGLVEGVVETDWLEVLDLASKRLVLDLLSSPECLKGHIPFVTRSSRIPEKVAALGELMPEAREPLERIKADGAAIRGYFLRTSPEFLSFEARKELGPLSASAESST